MQSHARAAIALAILLRAASAEAALTVYTSEAGFLAAVGPLTVEGFEAAPFGPVPSYTSGPLTTSTANANLNATNVPLLISQGGRSIYWNDAAQHGDITFQLDAPISAFSIDVKNLGVQRGPTTLSASIDGGAFFDVFTNATGPPGNLRFVGFVDDALFSQITLSNSTVGDLTGLDRAQYGFIIPEPGTAALLAAGLAALGVRPCRRR